MTRPARALAATLAPALGNVRRLAMLAVLLAFAFQAYAVQTHLHGQPVQPGSFQLAQSGDAGGPLPADPLDPATCKLCRELVHAGAAVTPAGPALTLLLDWVAAFFPPAQLPATAIAPETGWQSRAPPRN